MRKIACTYKFIILFVLISGLKERSYAQEPINLVFMSSVPQSFKINPASDVHYNWWMGIPALSGIYAGFENSGFRYKDVIYRTSDDSLHIDIDGFLNSLKKTNTLSLEMQTELLACGFHIKNYYFDIKLSKRSSTALNYSKDLMGFLLKLNGQYINKEASFSGTGINASLFQEISLGISHPINDKWSVGGRLKFLSGVFNIYSKKTDISLYTDESQAYKLTLRSDIEINTSIPGLIVDPTDFLNFSFNNGELVKELTQMKNPGYGLDLGVEYTPSEKFRFGLSITDLGFITWDNNATNYVTNKEHGSFSFEGIDIYEFFENDTLSFSTQMNKVLDSLKISLGLDTKYHSYTSPLRTLVNLTGEYSLGKMDKVGGLLRLEKLNDEIRPALCVNFNHQFRRWFQVMAGYSLSPGNYLNIGLGCSLKLGAYEIYVITDNAYAFLDPRNFKSTNIMFGMNLCFGKR